MAAKCPDAEPDTGSEPKESRPLTHVGVPIPPWTDTAREYLVLERFPHLQKRYEQGLDCLTVEERLELLKLVEELEMKHKQEESFVPEGVPTSPPLHGKVSLLPGGHLAHVAADAVVNSANNFLSTGKGVNGALHGAAGRCLLDECVELGGCDVGQAKLTWGYNLPARHVIHTVGPEAKFLERAHLLRLCYWNSLELCKKHELRTVAFCCISTGMYAYPSVEAANVALGTVKEWLLTEENYNLIDRIVFAVRRSRDEESYYRLMLRYFPIN